MRSQYPAIRTYRLHEEDFLSRERLCKECHCVTIHRVLPKENCFQCVSCFTKAGKWRWEIMAKEANEPRIFISFLQGLKKLIAEIERTGKYLPSDTLWYILTAFRGPDDADGEHWLAKARMKNVTTQVIRDWVDNFDPEHLPTFPEPTVTRADVVELCGCHFADHLGMAEETIQRFDSLFKIYKQEESNDESD